MERVVSNIGDAVGNCNTRDAELGVKRPAAYGGNGEPINGLRNADGTARTNISRDGDCTLVGCVRVVCGSANNWEQGDRKQRHAEEPRVSPPQCGQSQAEEVGGCWPHTFSGWHHGED